MAISAVRFSVASSTASKYQAAGISIPSDPPAGTNSTFSVSARLTRSSFRSITRAGVRADSAYVGMPYQIRVLSVGATMRHTPSGHVPNESDVSATIQAVGAWQVQWQHEPPPETFSPLTFVTVSPSAST